MKSRGWNLALGAVFVCSLLLLFGQGMAFPYFSPFTVFLLHILPALSIQWLLCRVSQSALVRGLPLLLTTALALWGLWLFLTSPHWSHATLGGYLADYVSPAMGCALTLAAFRLTHRK